MNFVHNIIHRLCIKSWEQPSIHNRKQYKYNKTDPRFQRKDWIYPHVQGLVYIFYLQYYILFINCLQFDMIPKGPSSAVHRVFFHLRMFLTFHGQNVLMVKGIFGVSPRGGADRWNRRSTRTLASVRRFTASASAWARKTAAKFLPLVVKRAEKFWPLNDKDH